MGALIEKPAALFLAAVIMTLSLYSCTAQSESEAPCIGLGVTQIEDTYNAQGRCHVFFGRNEQTQEPIFWRVLQSGHDFDDSSEGNQQGLFLLSESVQGTTRFGSSTSWSGGSAEQWCEAFFIEAMNVSEQRCIAPTTRYEPEAGTWGDSSLAGARVFFLSASEAQNREYGFVRDGDREARDEAGVNTSWWLRTAVVGDELRCWYKRATGQPGISYVGLDNGARPALNIDEHEIVFTMPANDEPSAAVEEGEALPAVSVVESDGSFLLALCDEDSLGLSIPAIKKDGETVRFEYVLDTLADIQEGQECFLSLMVTDKDYETVVAYGRVGTVVQGQSGSFSITVPDDFDQQGLKLWIFAELHCQGGSVVVTNPYLMAEGGQGVA